MFSKLVVMNKGCDLNFLWSMLIIILGGNLQIFHHIFMIEIYFIFVLILIQFGGKMDKLKMLTLKCDESQKLF